MTDALMEKLLNQKVARRPDFVGYKRVSVWVNQSKDGKPYLNIVEDSKFTCVKMEENDGKNNFDKK